MHCIANHYNTNEQTIASFSSNVHAAASTESQPPQPKKTKGLSKILNQCLGHTHSLSAALSLEEKSKQELDQYLSHSHLDVDESPMEWWKPQSREAPFFMYNKCFL